MSITILLAACVILISVLLSKFTQKVGMPMLLVFILLGLIFGTDGIFKIPFDNYALAEKVCSVVLIFIIFYGGFGTNWKQAKPVAVRSAVLSTVGVVLTALIVAIICHYILGVALLESFLIGAVISSTDAASVFSILRSKRLGLKNNTDSMLELESGSNDPSSYMLMVIVLAVMNSGISATSTVALVFAQFFFGILFGVSIGFGAALFMHRFRFTTDGFDMAFVTGIALLSFSAPTLVDGNGYLSTYLCSIILGNQRNKNQKALVNFFDGLTGLMQMLIFFLLGLLATPSKIPEILPLALGVMFILTFIARPISVFAILTPFGCGIRQQLLVSFAGLRGAASICFAIIATVSQADIGNDIFHIVFCIVLLSITFQGSLLAPVARWLGMTDKNIDVLKTFSDYSERVDLQFIEVKLEQGHAWIRNTVQSITLPPEVLIIMLLRNGKQMIPNGKTVLQENDILILSANSYLNKDDIRLQEYKVLSNSEWIGKTIIEFSPSSDELVIMIIRGEQTIMPKGNTVIKEGDILVIHSDYIESTPV